jgi:hypothetical protein
MGNELARFDGHPSQLVRELLRGEESDRAAARAAAASSPSTALAILNSGYVSEKIGLPALARATDEVLGLVSNPAQAREMLNQEFGRDAQADLARAHSDLSSVIVQIADPQVVIAALVGDSYAPKKVDVCWLLMAWAANLKDRKDWENLLEMEVAGRTLRDLLIAGVFHEANSDVEEITPDMWVKVGLEEETERLLQMLEEETLPRFSSGEITHARIRLQEQRLAFEDALSPADRARGEVEI